MSGSGGQGKRMISSVKEENITELRAAGYLAKEITHRLPTEGQVVPTPKPTERNTTAAARSGTAAVAASKTAEADRQPEPTSRRPARRPSRRTRLRWLTSLLPLVA